jgi:hypothetical protein
MIDSDYLKRRSQELGLGREEALAKIQTWLEAQYPAHCRALSLNNGLLRVITADSSVASDLRLRQIEIIQIFTPDGVAKLAISIRG